MKRFIFLLGILYVCSADDYHTPVEALRTDATYVINPEDEQLNSVDGEPNQLNIKLLSFPADKTSNIDKAGSEILTTAVILEKASDASIERDTTTPSVSLPGVENIPDSVFEKKGNPNSGGDLDRLSSSTGISEEVLTAEFDSKLSDIPADEPGVISNESTEQTVANSDGLSTDSSITKTDQNGNTEPQVNSENLPETSSEKQVTEGSETIQPGVVYTPTRPKIQTTTASYSSSPDPLQTTEVTYNADDMNKRRTTSISTTTEKVPDDTPAYPLVPSIPTDEEGILLPRPPIRRGQLDIRISIPHIFHMTLGDTEDGHRRLGIQSPFFRFDLTKSRLKIFRK